MPSVFDGMTGILADVLGSPVIWQPLRGTARPVQSIFREEPIEVLGADGLPVVVSQPTWRVPARLVTIWSEGDTILPGNGKTYRLVHVMPSASPAPDRMLTFPLEECT